MPTSFGDNIFVDEINVTTAKIASLDLKEGLNSFDPPLNIETPNIEQVLTKGEDAAGKDLNNILYLRTTNAVFAQNGTIEGNAVAKCVCTDLDLSDDSNILTQKFYDALDAIDDLITRIEAIELVLMEGGPK